MKDLGGFLLSYIFGNSILGKDPVPGEIYQEFDQKGNPFAEKSTFVKVLAVENGYVLYDFYYEYETRFLSLSKSSLTIKMFLSMFEKVDDIVEVSNEINNRSNFNLKMNLVRYESGK